MNRNPAPKPQDWYHGSPKSLRVRSVNARPGTAWETSAWSSENLNNLVITFQRRAPVDMHDTRYCLDDPQFRDAEIRIYAAPCDRDPSASSRSATSTASNAVRGLRLPRPSALRKKMKSGSTKLSSLEPEGSLDATRKASGAVLIKW